MEFEEKQYRTWGIVCHLSALLAITSIPLAHVLGPLIVWLIKKDESPFIDENGKEALNFQISMTIYAIVLFIIVFFTGISSWLAYSEFRFVAYFGFFAIFFLVAIVDLIFVIIAAVKSSNGEIYHYPLKIRFIK